MANLKISQLTAGAPAQLTDVLPIERGGVPPNYSLMVSDILALAAGAPNVAAIPWSSQSGDLGGTVDAASTAVYVVPAGMILATPATWTISFVVPSAGSITFDDCAVARTLPGSHAVVDWTNITLGGPFPITLSPGYITSDTISLQIDAVHDYYFMVHATYPQSHYELASLTAAGNTQPFYAGFHAGSMGDGVTNEIGTSPIQNPAFGGGELAGLWLAAWTAA